LLTMISMMRELDNFYRTKRRDCSSMLSQRISSDDASGIRHTASWPSEIYSYQRSFGRATGSLLVSEYDSGLFRMSWMGFGSRGVVGSALYDRKRRTGGRSRTLAPPRGAAWIIVCI
jgi:hypothetical protein